LGSKTRLLTRLRAASARQAGLIRRIGHKRTQPPSPRLWRAKKITKEAKKYDFFYAFFVFLRGNHLLFGWMREIHAITRQFFFEGGIRRY
jgi:hypothetical protein